jgi:hypothetical protein
MQPQTEESYRPADMIELHDSGFVLMRKNASDVENGWREYISLAGRTYTIDGEQVAHIAKYLDINYQPIITERTGSRHVRHALKETTFSIQPQVTVIGTGESGAYQEHFQVIEELSAWIERRTYST